MTSNWKSEKTTKYKDAVLFMAMVECSFGGSTGLYKYQWTDLALNRFF